MKKHIFIIISCLLFSACTAATAVVGVGATTFNSSRPFKQQMLDHKIKIKIMDEFAETNKQLLTNLSVTVYNRKVLLTGVLPNIDTIADAIKATWSISEVTEVINEIVIDTNPNINEASKDAYLRNRITRKLLFTSNICSSNYKYTVVNRNLYIIGEYQNNAEKQLLDNTLRQINGIKRIISYVKQAK